MAYSRTSPAQVLAQLGIGVGLAALAYRALSPSQKREPDASQSDVIAALEAEIREHTAAKAWGLQPAGAASAKPQPARAAQPGKPGT